MPPAKKETPVSISIPRPRVATLDVCLIGLTPYLCNRMSEKVKRSLLLPGERKNAAARAATLKHVPVEEFRSSVYQLSLDEPTFIGVPSASVKRAMAEAALDVPGAAKAQIGRLVWAESQDREYVSIYGVPRLYMGITRSADVARTPDVRTLCIIPRWAVRLNLRFVEPQLTSQAVVNLLAMAGFTVGIGDGRPQKGKLSFGQFQVVDPEDPAFREIIETGGRDVQEAAMEEAIPYDEEAAEMLTWFEEEIDRQGRRPSTNGTDPSAKVVAK